MQEDRIEALLLDCLQECAQEITIMDDITFMMNNIKPQFIVKKLAQKLLDHEKELMNILL